MNKKGLFGMVVKIVIILLIFLAVYATFFKVEFYEDAWDTMTNLFDLPERDPVPFESGGFVANAAALKIFDEMVNDFETVANTSSPFCFGVFNAPPEDFFDKQRYSIRIRASTKALDSSKKGTAFQLFQSKQGNELKSDLQKEISSMFPISSPRFVENLNPCVILMNETNDVYSTAHNFQKKILDAEPSKWSENGIIAYEETDEIRMYHFEKILFQDIPKTGKHKYKHYDIDFEYSSGGHYFIVKLNDNLCLLAYNDINKNLIDKLNTPAGKSHICKGFESRIS